MAEINDLTQAEKDALMALGEAKKNILLKKLSSEQLKKWLFDKKRHDGFIEETNELRELYDVERKAKRDSRLIIDARSAWNDAVAKSSKLEAELDSISGFERSEKEDDREAEDKADQVGSEAILTDAKYLENLNKQVENKEVIKNTSADYKEREDERDVVDESDSEKKELTL